jgi:hypothetical protein
MSFWHDMCVLERSSMVVLWFELRSLSLSLRQRRQWDCEIASKHCTTQSFLWRVSRTFLSLIFFHPTKTKSSETRAIWRTLVEFNELFACLILIIVLPTLIDTFLPHTSYNHNNIFVMFHPYHLFLMYDFKVLLYLFFLLKIIRVNYTWVN